MLDILRMRFVYTSRISCHPAILPCCPYFTNHSLTFATTPSPVTKLLQKLMDATTTRLNIGVLVRFLI